MSRNSAIGFCSIQRMMVAGLCSASSNRNRNLRGRLPKLDPVTFRVRKPSKSPVVVFLAPGIDRGTGGRNTFQNSVEIIHLEIKHGGLGHRKIFRRLRKEGDCNVCALHFPRKRKTSVGTGDALDASRTNHKELSDRRLAKTR